MAESHHVFVTGATGYIGTRLIPELCARGNTVTALTRLHSQRKLPEGCVAVFGNALDADSYSASVAGADTLIHLVGVSHPSPAKARQFVEIDGKSAEAAIRVASRNSIRHFIYLSVARPAPVMRAYGEVRFRCEEILRASGLNATVVRPWYVLGPGHRWPYALLPFYRLAELFPHTRESALRLGLVTLRELVQVLAAAVDNPPTGVRIIEVPEIRQLARRPAR